MPTNIILNIFTISLAITLYPASLHAYIGPGLGAGTIGVILGVLVSVLLALFAIFWYPLKRMFKKGKKNQNEDAKE